MKQRHRHISQPRIFVSSRRRAKGISLVDVLACLCIALLLVSVALPLLSESRERARSAQCQKNLRRAGVSLLTYSMQEPRSAYCSGASDYRRDGCMDTYGWIADCVNQGMRLNDLRDASNPLNATQKLNDLLGRDPSDGLDGVPAARLKAGICGKAKWKGLAPEKPTKFFAGTRNGSVERAELVSRYFMEQGFSSNYAASWTLVRSGIQLQAKREEVFTAAEGSFRGGKGTLGPLTVRQMDRSFVPAANVPLLGCSSPGDLDNSILAQSVEHDPDGLWAGHGSPRAKHLAAGELLSQANNSGPVYFDAQEQQLVSIKNSVSIATQLEMERRLPRRFDNPTGTAKDGNGVYLQDTRAWFAVHRGSLNLLMADGSVKSFQDRNGDGYLNPGFGVFAKDKATKKRLAKTVGYTDAMVEFPVSEVYCGLFLVIHHKAEF